MKFNIPQSPTRREIILGDFAGVDFTSAKADTRRCSNGYNFTNNNGVIEKRNGYKVLAWLGNDANINGVWNVDTTTDEFFVVHCGTKLYEMKTDFSSYQVVLEGMKDTISNGEIIGGKLLIVDGKRAVVYDPLVDTDRVKYLDQMGYIPITQISRFPNGTMSQSFESPNQIQNKRINMFLSNDTDTEYQLDATGLVSVDLVEVMDMNGNWQKRTDFTVDLINGKVIFTSPIGNPPVDGRDSVRITFSVKTDLTLINKCTIMTAYGYNGSNNRVFLSGNDEYSNMIMYSHFNDITYMPVENIMRIGMITAPVTGFSKLNSGQLAVLKDVSDTDSTIFILGSAMYNGVEAFPILDSHRSEGNIGRNAQDNLINEPFILTRNGIFAVNTGELSEEKFTQHRSYYIDGKLLKESNLKNAVGITNQGKYYLAINDNVYVADSRFRSIAENSRLTNFQYEWYYWTGLPVRVWFKWEGKLYFGDKSGNICTFRDNDDTDRFLDIDTPVQSLWTSTMLNLGTITYKKNIRRVSIGTSNDSELVVGYVLKSGEKEVLDRIFANVDFPKVASIRKKAKKLSQLSIYVESENAYNMSFDEIGFIYTVGNYYKGD